MKIGVFGGSFDPVHRGHVEAVKQLKRKLDLDLVLVIPNYRQPLKEPCSAAATHRLEMVRLAFEDEPGVEVDPCEVQRGGDSYTVETLSELRNRFPDNELCLLIGADAARTLPQWHRASEIADLARVVVFNRAGAAGEHGFEEVAIPEVDVAATDIRALLREGKVPDELIPERVLQYMRAHGLYGLK